jgi:hypothetical protein
MYNNDEFNKIFIVRLVSYKKYYIATFYFIIIYIHLRSFNIEGKFNKKSY